MNHSKHTEASRPSEGRRVYPPIAGGDPTLPSDAAQQMVDTLGGRSADQPSSAVTDAPAASGGTSEAPEGFDTPFRLEEVPEEYRPHVERYNKQLQGAYTRKTQELASQRNELKPLIELQGALDGTDEPARDRAIAELLTKHGWQVDDFAPDAQAAAQRVDDALTPAAAQPPVTDPALLARLEQAERNSTTALERQQSRDQAEYQQQFVSRVDTAVNAWAKKHGLVDDTGATRTFVRNGIVAQLQSVAPLEENGSQWPDMESAIALYEAQRAAERQSFLASKDVPAPNASGDSGRAAFNPRDDKQRLARANEIAGRHL